MSKLKPIPGNPGPYKGMQLNIIRRYGKSLFRRLYSKNLLVMKLVLVLLITTCLQVAARPSDAQRVTISGKNMSLKNIFREIREQTDFQFFYKNEYLKDAKPVDIHVKDASIKEALDVCFQNQPLTYGLAGKIIVVKKKVENGDKNALQKREIDTSYVIKGRVFNTEEPPVGLPGVIIRVKGTHRGTTTDADGYYKIKANKNDVLVFSLLGYDTVAQTVLKQYKNLVISLRENVSELNQLTVVGMNRMKRSNIASSVASLNVRSNIRGKPITSLSQALQGGVTGLTVRQSSALPGGDAATIKIRGISTLGNSDPLVLVDGVPMDMEQINPATVASVTILKDAAAAAIYGARAANGVILITTKRGKPGRVTIDYDGYYGVQSPSILPKMVDAVTYMRMYNIAQINAGGQPLYTEEDIQKTESGKYPLQYPNTDWIKEVLDLSAPITNHSLSVTGGNHLARFAITGNYMYQGGLVPKIKQHRYNLRANTSITLSNKVYFYLDALIISRNDIYPDLALGNDGTRFLEDLYMVPPNVVPKFPKEKGWPTIYGRFANLINPLAHLEQGGYNKYEYTQSSINIQPRWEVFPGFNIRGQFSFRLKNMLYHGVRDNFYFFDYYTKQLAQTWKVQRSASTQLRDHYYYLSGTADYTWDHEGHHIFALAGYSQEVYHHNYWDISSLQSFFGKVNYSYQNKYLLEASLRADGSSKFGPGHKFGYFPSAAVGWNISNENFLKNSGIIKQWKVRASYGELGNQNIGLYKYQDLINAKNGEETVWGNPDITWERVDMLDIGTDVSLFTNDKLQLTFDYYNKLTKGMILTPAVSYVAAVGSAPLNVGRIRNRGWELSLKYNNQFGQNVSLSVRSGVSYNKNKILRLKGGSFISGGQIRKEGFSIHSYYGYKTDGLLQAADFEKDRKTPKVPIVNGEAPGDVRYLDLNGDGVINSDDKRVIGKAISPYNYFADINIRWKRFNLEFLLQGTKGNDVSGNLNDTKGYLFVPLNFDQSGGVPTVYRAAHTWRRNNTHARFPRIIAHPSMDWLDSDFWLWNGAYMRVKYIQLSYNLNIPYLKEKGIRSAQVYINAQNPFVFTSVPLTDPESHGGTWTYGIMKMYTVGLHIKL